MRTLFTCLAALCLVAAGCGDDDVSSPTAPAPSESTSTTTTTVTTTTRESEPPTTTAPPGGDVELVRSCTTPTAITVSYPEDWEAVNDCGQFGPAPLEEPAPATDERTGIVSVFVDPVGFDDAVVPSEAETARASTTVDGRRAMRIEHRATGEGLYPEGSESVRWSVELSDGDGEPRTLFLDAVDAVADVDFARAVAVLDAMARDLGFADASAPHGDQVVARYAGGGAPVTVAAAGSASSPATCLRIVEPDDVEPGIACVQEVDDRAGVSVTSLTGPSGPLTVGIAGPAVFAVSVDTAETPFTFLPVTYPARDSRAFAMPVDPAEITTVTLRGVDGSVLARVPRQDALRPADG